MGARFLRTVAPPPGGCACLGGYVASCLGAILGEFPGMEPAGALAAASAAWILDGFGILPLSSRHPEGDRP